MSVIIDFDMLERLGVEMHENAISYQQEIQNIYTIIENVTSKWTGNDKNAYVNKVNNDRASIEKLGTLLDQYGSFLIQTANNMRDIQDQSSSTVGKI